MPIKARRSKRRGGTPEAEIEAWGLTFESGVDFLGEITADGGAHCCPPLQRCNCKMPYWGNRPPRDLIEQKWRQLGAAFLARRRPDGRTPWAVQQFGEPSKRGSSAGAQASRRISDQMALVPRGTLTVGLAGQPARAFEASPPARCQPSRR